MEPVHNGTHIHNKEYYEGDNEPAWRTRWLHIVVCVCVTVVNNANIYCHIRHEPSSVALPSLYIDSSPSLGSWSSRSYSSWGDIHGYV